MTLGEAKCQGCGRRLYAGWETVSYLVGLSLIAVYAFVALWWALTPPAQAQTKTELKGVASVIDGDTIEIHGQRIRLNGFDTPESGKSCGTVNVYQKASFALSDFVGTKTVICTGDGSKDNYGRLVATRSVGGIDLGDRIVGLGWGRDWPRYAKKKYAEDEAAARAAKRGIWGTNCPADLWSGRSYDEP